MNIGAPMSPRGRFFVVLIAVSGAFARPASACSNHPSTCEYHQQVHNWNQERARQTAEDYANSQQEARQRRADQQRDTEPAPDPTQKHLNAVVAMVHGAKRDIENIDKMAKDPRFQAVRKGQWRFFQDTNDSRPGEFCAAMFMNLQGFVRVSGPGADYRGALLTFWGPQIPMPAALRKIPVSLTQSDDGQTQTVQAFNYTDRSLKIPTGAIAFAVPTADALLSNMHDKLGFNLAVSGEPVLDITWHGGAGARDNLRRCLAMRARGG